MASVTRCLYTAMNADSPTSGTSLGGVSHCRDTSFYLPNDGPVKGVRLSGIKAVCCSASVCIAATITHCRIDPQQAPRGHGTAGQARDARRLFSMACGGHGGHHARQ
jgi:hypothetical protein